MKATKTTKQITFAAVLAALYTALTFLQGVLLPSSVTMDVQFRTVPARMAKPSHLSPAVSFIS